jgi:hypothetical protein
VACPAYPERRDRCACALGLLGGALLVCSARHPGEDRGTQGRQVACPAYPERRDRCACALGLLGGALLVCGARIKGEEK